ncbi:asparagine synthetase B family protein [Pseudoalteromonas sp. Ps84H-4]|uniref:asparagine synthase family protein n=1 Tax=Pseudoalteromonas sp. Ps84H-4 TaxID=2954502 RepID=UPI002097EA9B|nr:asparagine synthetase B family protein [Pseudoalteromonas sp. Ps84H-4]MCO7251754.1 asparagine synthetase B family protein [Pseudoalteromonas sp. Ps84H-4]
MEIKLSNNKGYCWQLSKTLSFKGVIWGCNSEKELKFEDVSKLLSEVDSISDMQKSLDGLDGHFSFILETERKVYLVVDRLRTIPLFYSLGKKILVSDNTYFFKNNGKNYNELITEEFLSTGYVIGKETMLEGVNQVQAGEIVCIDKVSFEIERFDYFLYRYREAFSNEIHELRLKLEKIYDSVFKSLIERLKNKQVVLPLSGGYDSRLVIYMFHKYGYKNLICFTYGDKDNWEVKISKNVAKFYGYDWHFLEYTSNELFQFYQNNVEDYFQFSVQDSSAGHTQDLLAVKKLKDLNLIESDAVFIPGHSGDFVAGSHIPSTYEKIDVTSFLFNKHCSLLPVTSCDIVKSKIKAQISFLDKGNKFDSAESIEYWDWRERQAKYICNSVRVYEYYSYKWLLPLWDKRIMEFWLKVPVELKLNRKLYFSFANEIHGEIKSNPKRSVFGKLFDKIFDKWYSRFFKSPYSFHFKTINDAFPGVKLPKHIDGNCPLIKTNKIGLNTLKMWKSTQSK